jgi:hypothetical protein
MALRRAEDHLGSDTEEAGTPVRARAAGTAGRGVPLMNGVVPVENVPASSGRPATDRP